MGYYKNINDFLTLYTRNGSVGFTNGCFDLLHAGHVSYLKSAKELCDNLIVGMNSDESVRKLKGISRPIQNEDDRAFILSELKCVDAVILFDEDTPYNLIKQIRPDILIKGGDYNIDNIIGSDLIANTVTIPFLNGHSSSSIINKILTNTMLHDKLK